MRYLPICLKRICIAIGFLSLNAVYSESETQPNVRSTHWYDTLEQVKENETAEFVEHSQVLVEYDSGKPKYFDSEEDVLVYKGTFHTKPIILAYHFDSICKQLYLVKYIINDVLSSDDANEIAKYLDNKFSIKLQREQLDDENDPGYSYYGNATGNTNISIWNEREDLKFTEISFSSIDFESSCPAKDMLSENKSHSSN